MEYGAKESVRFCIGVLIAFRVTHMLRVFLVLHPCWMKACVGNASRLGAV
ncbi:hypothetical protein SAMN05192543_103312 [Paraburkholderia megapolitana]|uniref:Uncharacterized protein n=1 Tax=Paraburkholderia megapolitana TaxID=420953 RepID=A0A1I3IL79_9BURK|nr:hypothetical protein SAMN05192543_103312 [Paraburkholderia megapolitana]